MSQVNWGPQNILTIAELDRALQEWRAALREPPIAEIADQVDREARELARTFGRFYGKPSARLLIPKETECPEFLKQACELGERPIPIVVSAWLPPGAAVLTAGELDWQCPSNLCVIRFAPEEVADGSAKQTDA